MEYSSLKSSVLAFSIFSLIIYDKYKMLSDIGLIIIAILQVAIGFKWHNIIKNNQVHR